MRQYQVICTRPRPGHLAFPIVTTVDRFDDWNKAQNEAEQLNHSDGSWPPPYSVRECDAATKNSNPITSVVTAVAGLFQVVAIVGIVAVALIFGATKGLYERWMAPTAAISTPAIQVIAPSVEPINSIDEDQSKHVPHADGYAEAQAERDQVTEDHQVTEDDTRIQAELAAKTEAKEVQAKLAAEEQAKLAAREAQRKVDRTAATVRDIQVQADLATAEGAKQDERRAMIERKEAEFNARWVQSQANARRQAGH